MPRERRANGAGVCPTVRVMIAGSIRGPLVAVFGLYLVATTALSLLVRSALAVAVVARRHSNATDSRRKRCKHQLDDAVRGAVPARRAGRRRLDALPDAPLKPAVGFSTPEIGTDTPRFPR
jgi:Flp pilus assembly protein TadB